ncbi:hypothetical protein ACEPAF_8789 [Sanghuangporus sanghuang]
MLSRALKRPILLGSHRRQFSYTCPRFQEVPNFGSASTKAKEAQIETHDVTTIDRLLDQIRSRSDPANRTVFPIRSSRPWTEMLLNSIHDASEPVREMQIPQSPAELPPRHMHDSYSQIDLPFASDKQLLEQYVNAWGGIRTGKLMEHLDSLAGSIAYKHLLGPAAETVGKIKERGFYVVTAAVDRLDMLANLYPIRNLRLGGHVIYTGRSSMEIAVKMEALEHDGKAQTIMLGRFSMVCRDATTHKARPVNPLIVSSPEEQALVAIGEVHKRRKTYLFQRSLSRVPPSSEEAQALHYVYLSSLQPQGDTEKVPMADTQLEKTLLMFPQERNIHQKVFGGYLVRLAYELGFTTASVFARKRRLRFLSLDGIGFKCPVSIGSVLQLTSQVTHTSTEELPAVVHVFVKANVIDVKTGTEQHTNDFKFTWGEIDPESEPLRRMVVPQTYAESMKWIEGRRALEYGAQILPCILSIRQTCRRFNELTRYRSVWLEACRRFIIDEDLPFPHKSLDNVDSTELEKWTRRALVLEAAWRHKARSPCRTLSFVGGPLNGLQTVRFVLKRENEWIIAVSEGIWPVIGCWDLHFAHNGSPTKVGEWFCRGATIKDIAVDANLENDAFIAVSIDNYSQRKRYIEIQRIRPVPQTREVTFETIKTLDISYNPVLLDGDVLVTSDEYSQVQIMNWKTGEFAILKGSEEQDNVIQHNKCLQVLFAHQGIFVARSRSIELFPNVVLHKPEEAIPLVRPLKTCSFGWIDGIAMAPLWKYDPDYSKETICVVIRAEEGNPWMSDIHSLRYYIIPMGGDPDPDPSSYMFPPIQLASVASKRGFMRCPTLALGPAGTSLWVSSGVDISGARTQDLWSSIWLGPMRDGTSLEKLGWRRSKLISTGDRGRTVWTSMDYVESRGCIALGAVDGSVTVLYLVD